MKFSNEHILRTVLHLAEENIKSHPGWTRPETLIEFIDQLYEHLTAPNSKD